MISKHLRLLRSAGLVVTRHDGTARICGLNAKPSRAINEMFWSETMQNLNSMAEFGGNLSIKAMYPVILITGCCGEASGFWNPSDLGSQTLKSRFDALKIPYDDRFLTPNGGIITGLITSGSTTVAVQTSLIAKTFGAKWVHWVAHSKGGLWARDAFRLLVDVGVLSFTTLDAPTTAASAAILWNSTG